MIVAPVVDPRRWDSFVETVAGDTLPQTTIWARTKGSRFSSTPLGVELDGTLVGGCMLMRGRIGPLDVIYAPRGPLITPGYDRCAPVLVDAIVELTSRWRPGIVLLQPTRDSPELTRAMEEHGFSRAPVDITTPATVEVPILADEDEMFGALRSSRRRNVRKARRAGLTVRRGDETDLATFAELHARTAERQGFEPMSAAYLHRQWDALGESGRLSIHLAELDGDALAAATTTIFGDRAVFKLAGLSDDPRATELRASDLLHWQIMVDAKQRGVAFYDLGGFDKQAARLIVDGGTPPEALRQSASQFKLGFGGEVRVLPEARWRVAPRVGRVAQRPFTELANRSARVQSALVRLRD